MNVYDAERVRVADDLKAGRITQSEFTKLARGIDRHQRAEGLSEQRADKYRAAQENNRRRLKQARLSSQLQASIYLDYMGDRL